MRLLDLMPNLAPMTPTLSHSASQTRVNALMLRSRLWHASRCALGEGAHRVCGTAVPNRNQAYSIRAEFAVRLSLLLGTERFRALSFPIIRLARRSRPSRPI